MFERALREILRPQNKISDVFRKLKQTEKPMTCGTKYEKRTEDLLKQRENKNFNVGRAQFE